MMKIMRGLVLVVVLVVLGSLVNGIYSVYREETKFGTKRYEKCIGYGTEQLKTNDGNVWNCGSEIFENREYQVVFGDNNTPDYVYDDIIIDFYLVK